MLSLTVLNESSWVYTSTSFRWIHRQAGITKTCLYNFDPMKPSFYIVKLGFAGVYIIFVISAKNIDCGYSLEPPRQGGSDEYPQSMFRAEIWKNIRVFVSENFQFLEVKFSICLNRRVVVMGICITTWSPHTELKILPDNIFFFTENMTWPFMWFMNYEALFSEKYKNKWNIWCLPNSLLAYKRLLTHKVPSKICCGLLSILVNFS